MASLRLPPDVVTWLGDYFEETLEENSERFVDMCETMERNLVKDWAVMCKKLDFRKMTNFELSVRLLRTSEYLGDRMPSEEKRFKEYVTAVLNCEYLIFKLNFRTSLKDNPFLPYWATSASKIQFALENSSPAEGDFSEKEVSILKLRLLIIHHALTSPDEAEGLKIWGPQHAIMKSPEQLVQEYTEMDVRRCLDLKMPDLREHADLLDEQGRERLNKPVEMSWRQNRSVTPASVPQTNAMGSPASAMPDTTAIMSWRNNGSATPMSVSDGSNTGRPLSGKFSWRHSSVAQRADTAQPASPSPVQQRATSGNSAQGQESFEDFMRRLGDQRFRVNIAEGDMPLNTDDIINGEDPAAYRHRSRSISSAITVKDILNAVEEFGSDEVVHALSRLPIDLPSLELLTNLLTDPALTNTSIEPVILVLEYIQHSLRTVERMASGSSPDSEVEGASSSDFFSDAVIVGGKDEQSRAVKLLLLFLKNLLRRGIVEHQDVYFDVEGMCIQYMWIPEVREFRKFLDGTSLLGEEASGPAAQGG
ncbi:hypothetical protein EJ08DRAFT_660186 [Tothia fuscella]|uniref:CCR4-NOT transcription complex subunit 11 n=1 Tax=Tothia fuscella TaxID=1048955 RepID=A0A9P4TZ38_9PEZI|nr:hypothetical protein EJ08DRAFT_660186 [Tothia fuscella]